MSRRSGRSSDTATGSVVYQLSVGRSSSTAYSFIRILSGGRTAAGVGFPRKCEPDMTAEGFDLAATQLLGGHPALSHHLRTQLP